MQLSQPIKGSHPKDRRGVLHSLRYERDGAAFCTGLKHLWKWNDEELELLEEGVGGNDLVTLSFIKRRETTLGLQLRKGTMG